MIRQTVLGNPIRTQPPAEPGAAGVNACPAVLPLLIIALGAIVVTPPPAAAQSPPAQVVDRSLVNNELIFGIGNFTRSERVIPLDAPGVIGMGPAATKLIADRQVTKRFITSEHYGSGKARHQRVVGLTIDGNQNIPDFAFGNKAEIARVVQVANGVDLDGAGAVIEGNRIMNFRGVGAVTRLSVSWVRDNEIHKCWTGIQAICSDVMIEGNVVADSRDYGLHVTNTSGNVLSRGNHYYGAQKACYNQNGLQFRGIADTYADAQYGIHSWGALSQFVGCMMQHCFVRAALFSAPGCEMTGCQVMVQMRTREWPNTVGVEFVGQRSAMYGGTVTLTNYVHHSNSNPFAAEAIRISGNECEMDTRLIDDDRVDGSIGMRVTAAIRGGRFRFRTHGFHQAKERLLIIEKAEIRDCQWEFRGADIDTTNPGKYIDVGPNWKPAGSNNEITLINTTTGATVSLANRAY